MIEALSTRRHCPGSTSLAKYDKDYPYARYHSVIGLWDEQHPYPELYPRYLLLCHIVYDEHYQIMCYSL